MRKVLAALVLLIGSSATAVAAYRVRTATFRPEALGAGCPATGRIADAPTAHGILAREGVWLRVAALGDGGRRRPEPRPVTGDYRVVGGDRESVRALGVPDRVTLPHETERAIRRALRAGATVYVHTDGWTPRSAYAVALTEDDFAFLGNCAHRFLTQPINTLYGPRARNAVGAVIGEPAAAARLMALPPSPRLPPPDRELTLGPGLRRGWLTVVAPPTWTGAYAVCAVDPRRGWTGCADLSSRVAARERVPVVYHPSGRLELWLYRVPVDRRDALDKVAVVPLARAARRAGLDAARDPLVIRVTFSDRAGVNDVVGHRPVEVFATVTLSRR